MTELITLKWPDGRTFLWNSASARDAREAMRLQRKYGDPSEIIGDGPTANLLRKKYVAYRADKANYKPNVMGTASELSGIAKEQLEEKFKENEKRLREYAVTRIRDPVKRFWKRIK